MSILIAGDNLKIVSFLFAFSLTMIIMITIFEYVAFDNKFYSEQFQKRSTLEHVSETWMLHQNIINFHQGVDADLNSLSYEEISHLLDVKNLYHFLIYLRGGLSVLAVGLVILMGYCFKERFFSLLTLSCVYSAIMGWLFFLFFMITMDSHFSDYFHNMHVYLFPSNSYSFDHTELLVNLYPQTLFFEMGKRFLFIGLGVFSLMLTFGMPAFILRSCATNGDKNLSLNSMKQK